MNELKESIMFQLRLVRTYIFRTIFKAEARLIDRLMEDNKEMTLMMNEAIQRQFELEDKIHSLEYQLEDMEIKKEFFQNKAMGLDSVDAERAELLWKVQQLEYKINELEQEIANLEYMREEN